MNFIDGIGQVHQEESGLALIQKTDYYDVLNNVKMARSLLAITLIFWGTDEYAFYLFSQYRMFFGVDTKIFIFLI